jgi:hypothetical protein
MCVSLGANSVRSSLQTYVLDLVNSKVGIGWYADILGLNINDDEKGVGRVALVWYHPISFSRALIFLNMSFMDST